MLCNTLNKTSIAFLVWVLFLVPIMTLNLGLQLTVTISLENCLSLDQAVSRDNNPFVHGALWLTFLVSNLILNQRKYSCMSADDSTYAL